MMRVSEGTEGTVTRRDLVLVARIKEITARGNNVEIRRKGDQYSIQEVSKKGFTI